VINTLYDVAGNIGGISGILHTLISMYSDSFPEENILPDVHCLVLGFYSDPEAKFEPNERIRFRRWFEKTFPLLHVVFVQYMGSRCFNLPLSVDSRVFSYPLLSIQSHVLSSTQILSLAATEYRLQV
jgi:hypothetical protein